MSEWYPSDEDLLALTEDEQTGVEYIATGQAPYYLQFRKMLYRVLLNVGPVGLRVYKTGDLSVRVKPGYYWLGGTLKQFTGSVADITLDNNDTTYLYVHTDNTIGDALDGDGWPATEHVKLAAVTTAAGDFDPEDDVVDLRGYSLLSSLHNLTATPAEINAIADGITATAAEVNQALDGIGGTVTQANLDTLTDTSEADALHAHTEIGSGGGTLAMTAAAETTLTSTGAGATRKVDTTAVSHQTVHDATGISDSADNGVTFTHRQLAPVHLHYVYDGEITANQTGKLAGLVAVAGTVEDVILSVQQNGADGTDALDITATAKVNGVALCSADPAIDKTAAADTFATTAAAGAGVTQATVKGDGTEDVSEGDIITVDLTLTRTTPENEITGVCVLVKIRPTAAS